MGSLERSLWDRVIAINLTAPYLFSKRAVNQFLAQEPSGGAIINIASMAAIKGCLAGEFICSLNITKVKALTITIKARPMSPASPVWWV